MRYHIRGWLSNFGAWCGGKFGATFQPYRRKPKNAAAAHITRADPAQPEGIPITERTRKNIDYTLHEEGDRMAKHEFGIMPKAPGNERYDCYEPEKYSVIAIDDEYIEPCLEEFDEIP